MSTMNSIILGVLLILGVGGFVFWQVQDVPVDTTIQANQPSNDTLSGAEFNAESEDEREDEWEDADDDSQPAQDTPATVTPAVSTGISSATVAQHSSRTSCWTSINGSVYDLTSWIPKHPGGEQAILQLCGTDGSAKFNGMHGGDKAKEKLLSGFKIGTFAN